MDAEKGDADPFSANKCQIDPPVRARWPTERTLRIITFNLNGRPPGLGSALSGTETKTDSGEPPGGFGACESAHHLATSATARGRGFLRWLDGLPPDLYPHALCLQELMWISLANMICEELERRGWKTLPAVDPRLDQGCPGGKIGCIVPQAGSGLALFVHQASGLSMIESGGFAFENRLGVDRLARKGFRWASVLIRSPALLGLPAGPLLSVSDSKCAIMMLATIHPQAYMPLGRAGPLAQATEGTLGFMLRKGATAEIESLGGYPLSVAKIHQLQFGEVADHLQQVALPSATKYKNRFVGAFIGGDFNVNRWATRPGTQEERNLETAALSCSTELHALLQTLDAVAPQLTKEPEESPFYAGHDGKFSWDGLFNSCARPLTPIEKPALGFLDYILFLRPSRARSAGLWSPWLGRSALPLRADNRVLLAALDPPCPELAPIFGSPVCAHVRSLLLKGPLLPVLEENAEERKEEMIWRKEYAVLNRLRNSRLKQEGRSDQTWKGLAQYGMKEDDPDVSFAKDIKVGQSHAFRWFTDVSDHHPVLGRFILSPL